MGTLMRLFIRLLLLLLGVSLLLVLFFTGLGPDMPVGTEIAYVSRGPGGIAWDIYLMDIDRGLAYPVSRLFIKGDIRSRWPVWSADGRELAFVSEVNRYQGMNLMVMNPDILTLRFVTTDPHDETAPVWSPAGGGAQRLAYESFNGWDWDIHIRAVYDENIVLAQAGQPLLQGRADDRKPQWSPDGAQLAFISNRGNLSNDLYLVNANGRDLRRLTDSMIVTNDFVWSPDGTHIAFVSRKDRNQEIYIVNIVTGNLTNLTNDPRSDDFAPDWSPDGEYIAFVSNRDGNNEIYVMDTAGEIMRRLTENWVYDSEPTWSPNGERIIFISEPIFTSELYTIRPDGTGLHRLTHNFVDDWSPAWRP